MVGAVTADWKGGSEPQMTAVVCAVAGLHRKFWGQTATHGGTSWITARQGLRYCKFVGGFIKNWIAYGLLFCSLLLLPLLATPLRPIPLFFAFALGISVEKAVPFMFPLLFPRSTAEALARPRQLFGLLVASGALPADAELHVRLRSCSSDVARLPHTTADRHES